MDAHESTAAAIEAPFRSEEPSWLVRTVFTTSTPSKSAATIYDGEISWLRKMNWRETALQVLSREATRAWRKLVCAEIEWGKGGKQTEVKKPVDSLILCAQTTMWNRNEFRPGDRSYHPQPKRSYLHYANAPHSSSLRRAFSGVTTLLM